METGACNSNRIARARLRGRTRTHARTRAHAGAPRVARGPLGVGATTPTKAGKSPASWERSSLTSLTSATHRTAPQAVSNELGHQIVAAGEYEVFFKGAGVGAATQASTLRANVTVTGAPRTVAKLGF